MVGKKKDTDTAVNFVNPLTVGDTDGDSDGSVDEGQTSFRECAPRAAGEHVNVTQTDTACACVFRMSATTTCPPHT